MTFRGKPLEGNEATTCKRIDISCQRHSFSPFANLLSVRERGFPPAYLPFVPQKSLHCPSMTIPPQPNVKLSNAPDYREAYANSVQMRVNVWDFFMVFGTLQQQTETQVEIRNFQGIYLSPQQAKALLGLLQQNVSGYESAFGEIKLDPRMTPAGPVH